MKIRAFLILILLTIAWPVLAQNTSTTQMQLVNSTTFINRLQYLLTQQAVVVKAEALNTVCHTKRSLFADQIIASPIETARASSVMIAGSTNVIGTVIIANGVADSSASDAALLSQVATLWNALSKCDTGS